MKHTIFIAVVAVIVLAWAFTLVDKVGNTKAQTEQTFRAECAAVNGRAVWNNKYWECLK